MERQRIESFLPLGIRSIDGILTFGEGQRTGIFAGSGVGKSVLLGMIAKGGQADINVIGLIGERGREVREFLERDLGAEGLKKSIVVCVTSDQSPLMRLRAANMVTAIAEYFSGRGKKDPKSDSIVLPHTYISFSVPSILTSDNIIEEL